ncbi:PulJ/GspJ family protein [Pectinatus haikarae]|uniref:PulJ/GspJ family protein n=1 Tax=Pectinatus haikarae TaxID=349096 RepID=UPI0018C855B8|nr:hypothetical protein [Pectinatus haikarae]
MNKQKGKNQAGSILLETLLSLNIYVFIMMSISVIFLAVLHMYLKNIYQMELRSQMRFAAECIIQDIKHADSVTVYQESGHDAIAITTRATTGSSEASAEFIKYRQDDLAFFPRIIKKGQPLTGDNDFCYTYVRFSCRPLSENKDNRVYLLELKGTHQFSSQYFYLDTAVTRLGSRSLN